MLNYQRVNHLTPKPWASCLPGDRLRRMEDRAAQVGAIGAGLQILGPWSWCGPEIVVNQWVLYGFV